MSAQSEQLVLRQTQLDALARLPRQLARLAATVDEHELTTPFLAGEWSVAQNLHHLADSHMNSFLRCKLILTEEEPTLKPYNQDRWAALADSQTAAVHSSLALLHGLHTRWMDFWNALEENDWQRAGLHPEIGRVTLATLLRIYGAHGAAHLLQIRQTLAAQYHTLPATPAELLARVDREWTRLQTLLAELDSSTLETPIDGGWSPKLHLAHLTLWENYLLRHLVGGEAAHLFFQLDPGSDPLAQIDTINAADEARSQQLPLDVVLEEAQRVHAAVRAALLTLEWPEWVRPGADGAPPVNGLIANSYEHYLEHWHSLLAA